jgi:uncharacterized protein (DUF4415 family)
MTTTDLTTVRPDEVPVFANEAEEAAWWATHDVEGPWERSRPEGLPSAEQFRQQRETRRGPRRSQPVLVRLDADVLDRLRALAERKGTGYQTLLKRFVTERLYEEEKREGLLPAGPEE